jgi:hypothetical protein
MVKTQVGAGFLFALVKHSLQTSAIREQNRHALRQKWLNARQHGNTQKHRYNTKSTRYNLAPARGNSSSCSKNDLTS